jgi:hypothetical protein
VSAFEATAFSLLFTLVALALIEHWFMVLPIPSEKLWQWGLASHAATAAGETAKLGPTDQVSASVAGPKVLPSTAANATAFHELTNMSHPIPEESCVNPLLHTGSTVVNFSLHSPATHRRCP